LWSELVERDGPECFNSGEDLSGGDLSNGDGDLDRHVGSYAKAAVLVGNFPV
jgi:hypothetical protein